MKFSDSSDQATQYLREAIPAMVRYEIVPNPLNYTLWYSYFSKACPNLNKELGALKGRLGQGEERRRIVLRVRWSR